MLLSRRLRARVWPQLGPGLFLLTTLVPRLADAQAPAVCATEAHAATNADGLLALARCYEKAGKTTSAWSAYKKVVVADLKEGKADAATQARGDVARLEKGLARVTVVMPPENVALAGAAVVRGEQAVPRGYWGIAVPVDPGDYVVKASAPGYKNVEANVTVAAGASSSVTLPVMEAGEGGAPVAAAAAAGAGVAVAGGATAAAAPTPAPAAAPAPVAAPTPAPAPAPAAAPAPVAVAPPPVEPPPPAAPPPAEPAAAPPPPAEPPPAAQAAASPPPPAEKAPKRGPGAGPWILGGAGLALAGAGTAFAFLGYQDNEAAKDICPNSPPDPCSASDVTEWRGHTSSASTNYMIAYIGWGVGGAAVIGAATWLIAGSGGSQSASATGAIPILATDRTQRRPTLALRPIASPSAFGVLATGSFQ